MAGALIGDAVITAARPRGARARRPARSASPGAFTRGRVRAKAAASRLPARGSSFGDANASSGARGAPDGATPAPTNSTSHVRREPPRASRVVPRATEDEDAYGAGGDYETGQTEVMRSVAERVKAARELAKRLASREEELAARNGTLPPTQPDSAPPAPPPPPNPPGPPPGTDAAAAEPEAAESEETSQSSEAEALLEADDLNESRSSSDDEDSSYDETEATEAAARDLMGEYNGNADAAAAAAAARSKLAEMEAAAAEAEASAFAARAVSDMDDAVTRIRQEAAKRVATAERERDRAKEQSRVAVAEVKQKKAAIEEMLRQIKLDADTRVRDAEDMMSEWEQLAETSRLAKLAAEEAMETKIKAAEETAAADVAAAEKRAAAKTAEAEKALADAKRDVDAAKIVQEEISRQEKEKYERLTAEAVSTADARVAEAESALEEATRRANEAQEGARSEAEEILKEELKNAEEALNAAEEIARIEVAAAEEAAAVLVAEKEEEARRAVEAAEAKVKKAVKQKEEEMQRRVVAAQEKAAADVAEAREEAEEAAKTAEAIAAAKDAVAKAVEEAEAEVASSMKKASESEKEVKKIRAAADARVDELTTDFSRRIEETREEAKQRAEAEIETATAKAEAAEKRVDEIKADAQKRADEAVEAAERAANEAIAAAKKRREEEITAAKTEAAAAIEAAKADFETKLEAARAKTKKAREEAAQFRQAASEAAEWEAAAAKAEAEAYAALEREAKANERTVEAEKTRDEAVEKLTDAELAAIAAGKETDAERAKVQEQIAATAAAVQAAVSEANEFSVMEIQKVRDELKAAEEAAARRVAEAEQREKQAKVDLERLAADKLSAEEHLEVKLAAALAEKEDAETRAAEARRVSEDLQANEPMEQAIEFEKRVASATAELERAVAAERDKAETAEHAAQQLEFKLGSLQHELETAQAELELSSSAELRQAKGESRVQTEIAALQVALEARDAEIRALKGEEGGGADDAPMPEHGPGASAAHIAAAQAAAGVAPAGGTPGASAPGSNDDKTAEELELEDLLNEVMALKGESGESGDETAQPAPTPAETPPDAAPDATPAASVESLQTMESVYAEAYHATLAARKAARRKEAETWASTQVAVVASSVKEVYHWLGGGPRHGDSAIIYNRRNPNGLGDGGQLFMHLGYNGWQGDPRQVGMRPLSHDHPSRTEYWLNDQGGDWWIAEPVFVPPEANVLDFVFSDGEGEYDNFAGKDYHSPVAGDDGSPPVEVDHVAEREAQLEAEQGHLDAQFAERAGRAAERKFVSRQGFDVKIAEDPATAKVVVVPDKPTAGGTIEIFYRRADDTSDPKAPLRGAADIFVQGGWNRWTHPDGFGPTRMEPAPRPPGGERAQSALVAKLQIPADAHVCDFVFTDDARTMEGRYDSRDGLDYHKSIAGASGGDKPSLRVVHVAVEMAPIAKVGGMGDVVTALSRAVIEDGHSVEVILPKYDCMDTDSIENLANVDAFAMKDDHAVYVWKGEVEEVPVTFLQPDTGHFDVGCIYGRGDDHVRFEYFSECALAYMTHAGIVPDVIHAHDWSTSHVCFARRNRLPPGAATVITIHNLQFGDDLIGRAMRKCTFATTVSPTYAEEISNHNAIAANASKMVGIRNGIDVELWDPLTDEYMPVNYNAETFAEGKSAARRELSERLGMELCETRPLVGVVARLTQQKGIHLIKHACWRALERGGQFVLLGSSPDGNVQNDFNTMAYEVGGQYPGQSGFVFAYDEPLSHLVYAASDMLLVPSMFEPCGLTQMIAMRYGTVPVVRRTGGLKDTVFDVDEDAPRAQEAGLRVNGFAFEGSQDYDIDHALDRALMTYDAEPEKWRSMVGDIMRQDWGWNDPAKTYVEHYWKAAKSMKDAYFSTRNRDDDDNR